MQTSIISTLKKVYSIGKNIKMIYSGGDNDDYAGYCYSKAEEQLFLVPAAKCL